MEKDVLAVFEEFFFFFLISNKISLIKRERNPSTQGGIQGGTNQKRTLQKSRKFKIEEKGWFLHTENQSNKFLKNRSLMSGMERSMSLKSFINIVNLKNLLMLLSLP